MRTLYSLVAVLMTVLIATTSYASHFSSADMNVTYVGDSTAPLRYRITLKIYKFCEGGPVMLSSTERAYISSTNLAYTGYRDLPALAEDTLDQLCAIYHTQNSCYNPSSFYPGYTTRTYTDTVSLPGRAADFIFSWTNASRNNAIVNLENPSTELIYLEAGLNNLIRTHISTPVFTGSPVAYLCVNNSRQFFNDPIDIDGDSLRILNKWPENGRNSNVPYAPGYTLANPIGSSTPYYVDSLTGVANFMIMNTGRYVLAFRANKYDRATGALIGYTSRDVQLSALACSSPVPTIRSTLQGVTGATLDSNGILTVPAGVSMAFDVTATNMSGTGNLSLSANNASAANGSAFSVTNPAAGTLTGHFSWTPTVGDIGDHFLKISSSDSDCTPAHPIVFTTATIISIRVVAARGVGIGNGATVKDGLTIAPNPAHESLTLQAHGKEISMVSMLDMTGRIIFIQQNPGSVIDLKNIAPGNYILKASGIFGTSYLRFVKN